MLSPSSSGIPQKNIGEDYYNYVKSVKERALFTRLSLSVAATELSEMNGDEFCSQLRQVSFSYLLHLTDDL